MTLSVSTLAPGAPLKMRVVGSVPNAVVSVHHGKAGGTTCPAALGGTCFALGNARKVGSAAADAAGNALVEVTLPQSIDEGTVYTLQAAATDAVTVTSYVSNVVQRTAVSAAAWTEPPLTNVLVVLVDDVGVDRIGLYGAERPASTPVLDALAAEGILFENAWSLPVCSAGRAALQTGRHARRTGYGTNPEIGPSFNAQLDPNLVTIAEVVEHSPWASWSSSLVGKWHLTSEGSTSGTRGPIVQGWDWWAGTMGNITNYESWEKVDSLGAVSIETNYATTDNVDDAVDRVAVMAEPWLLQVSFNAAHKTYHVPPAHLYTNGPLTNGSPDHELVKAMIEAADTEVGRLLGGIPGDVLARTTVIFTADNGTMSDALEPDEANYGRGKGTLFDGGVRVPFVVSGPLVGVPGSRTEAFAHIVDVLPTIADIAGVDVSVLRSSLDPESPVVLDGYSLLPTLADPSVTTARTRLYAERFEPAGDPPFEMDIRALRDDRYKLVVDETCLVELFFEYTSEGINEGQDLLPGALTPEQQEAYDRLRGEMTAYVSTLTYDSATLPKEPAAVPVCPHYQAELPALD